MSSSIYKAPTERDLVEIIEAEGIEHISGKPTCHTLLKLVNQLAAGCRAIECEYSNYGLSYLVLPQGLYQILTGENIVAPAPYPAVPPYDPNGTQTENNIIHIHWQKNKELKDQMDNCNKALIALTKNKFESKYRLQLQSLFTGIPDRTFIAFFNRIFDKWGRVNTFDIDANTERMRKTWDPTTDDMADLLQQIREGSIFAYYIKFPKQDHELVQIGERLILETGLFGTQFQNWKRRDEAQRTWADFEAFWQSEYDLWAETSQTAAQHGYGGNVEAPATTNNEVIEAEQAYLQSLQQFGATNTHNAATFENLSNTNQNLVNNMANQLQQLNMQVQHLANAVQGQQQKYLPPPPGFNQPPPQQQQQQQYQAPPQQGQFQAYQPQNNMHQGQYGRGRGRGRGRGSGRGGRGGGRGYQGQFTGQSPPYQGQGMYQPQGNYQGQMQGQGQGQTPVAQFTNPVKYFKNWNYCHSCGYDVEDWHYSATCPNPKPNHVWHATRQNPCDGCKKGQHKNRF
jgi:hypothetical protein